MNLGGLHRIRGKGIHKHHIIDCYRFHAHHDHRRNAWKGFLGVVFCTNDEACYVLNKGLILPQISSVPYNQLLTGFIWILSVLNIYTSGWIQSFKRLIGYLLGFQRRGLFSAETIKTSQRSRCRDCADVRVNWVAATRFPSVDVEESFDGRVPIDFLDVYRRRSSLDSELSSRQSM